MRRTRLCMQEVRLPLMMKRDTQAHQPPFGTFGWASLVRTEQSHCSLTLPFISALRYTDSFPLSLSKVIY